MSTFSIATVVSLHSISEAIWFFLREWLDRGMTEYNGVKMVRGRTKEELNMNQISTKEELKNYVK